MRDMPQTLLDNSFYSFSLKLKILDRALNSFSSYWASLAEARKNKESQNIEDLPVLVTCLSDTSVMLSSDFSGSAFMKALDNDMACRSFILFYGILSSMLFVHF